MDKNIFEYILPQELIAQDPLQRRDMSRLLVLDKSSGAVKHSRFDSFINHLGIGDCLVLNDTRVMPARLNGTKKGSGGRIEFVLLRRYEGNVWEVILKPGRRALPGSKFIFGEGILEAEVLSVLEDGNRLVEFRYDGTFEEVLDKTGVIPLPPYITKRLEDSERYQTVYSRYTGSAAAPTAGLHFTRELLDEIRKKGVSTEYITLHVGLGTFRPVKSDRIEDHKMHSEYYSIKLETAQAINRAKIKGKRVIAVGTTSCRVLETVSDENGMVREADGNTDIFIYPGYRFKCVDALLTNFHLPGSTLIMLVSAFAGTDNIMNAYREAIKEKYRFYSFGDAMLLK